MPADQRQARVSATSTIGLPDAPMSHFHDHQCREPVNMGANLAWPSWTHRRRKSEGRLRTPIHSPTGTPARVLPGNSREQDRPPEP